jgi:hypothetical protein
MAYEKKPYQDYKVGDRVKLRHIEYEVALKVTRSRFSPSANKTFKSKLLYLRALNAGENRVARLSTTNSISFEWKNGSWYNNQRVYETWSEKDIERILNKE